MSSVDKPQNLYGAELSNKQWSAVLGMGSGLLCIVVSCTWRGCTFSFSTNSRLVLHVFFSVDNQWKNNINSRWCDGVTRFSLAITVGVEIKSTAVGVMEFAADFLKCLSVEKQNEQACQHHTILA